MTNAKYFAHVLQELMQYGRCEIDLDSLPFALLRSQDEVQVDRIIPALKLTASAGMVSTRNLFFHGAEQPAQVAGLLNIIAANRLRTLHKGVAAQEAKESIYQDCFYVFCLAYEATNDEAFELVINQARGESVFLPPLAA